MRAVFICVLEFTGVFAEGLFALFADEGHVKGLEEGVRGLFCVAFGAVEPFFAAGRADGDLGVEDMFAHCGFGRWCLFVSSASIER